MFPGQTASLGAAGRLRQTIAAKLARHGYGEPGSIPEEMTFLEWCEDLAAKGLKVDAHPFTLADRPTVRSKIPTFTHKGEKREGQRAYTVHMRLPPDVAPFLHRFPRAFWPTG